MPPSNEIKTGTHLRIFDTNLNLIDERNLVARIDKAIFPHQYWGRGASQHYADGYYCIVAASPIGNTSYFNKGESIGARQIFILRFDENFDFIDSKGPLTNILHDNYYPTGSFYDHEMYYISYTTRRSGEGCVPGSPPSPSPTALRDPNPDGFFGVPGTFGGDQGNIRITIVDKCFNEVTTLDLTDFKTNSNRVIGAAHRSSLYKVGKKVYLGYDDPIGICIRELMIKEISIQQ